MLRMSWICSSILLHSWIWELDPSLARVTMLWYVAVWIDGLAALTLWWRYSTFCQVTLFLTVNCWTMQEQSLLSTWYFGWCHMALCLLYSRMNASTMSALTLDVMTRNRTLLNLWKQALTVCCNPLYACSEKRPVRLLYTVFSFMSPMTTHRHISSSYAAQTCSTGDLLLTRLRASIIIFQSLLLDLNSFWFCTRYPLSVVVDKGNCLLINSYINPGELLNNSEFILHCRNESD